jgi:hypothetical protein
MYIETARANPGATINIDTGAVAGSRTWKIKVSMIECGNPSRAPTDCLQYHTGLGDSFKSFNHPTGVIQNQEYEICIRQEAGFCSFEVSELTVTTPDAFDLDPAADDVAKHGAECTNSWISIGTSGTSDKYCGRKLNSISANTASSSILSENLPFRIGFFSKAAQDMPDASGFNLKYIQRPCT